jgi:cytochrome c-type biogenesis protein CcmH
MRTGDFAAAVKARANALRLLGPTADREADYGEAMVVAADGVVTAEAKAAFERAVSLDRENVSARFYLGLAAEQEGRKDEALAAWRGLLADAPPDAGWSDFVRRAIARAEGKDVASQKPADHPRPGRTTADVGKALGMPAQPPVAAADASALAQNEMVRGMVARLAERLRQDGSDVEGWLRLMRSYLVLGEAGKARAALSEARQALGTDAQKLRRLDAGVKDLGLEG